jgi:uncharacterized MnhB-related membrane protein
LKLLILLAVAGAGCAAALFFRWGPFSRPGTGLVAVMSIAALMVFVALRWLTQDRRRQAVIAGVLALAAGLAGAAAYAGRGPELLAATEAELAGSYLMPRAEGKLEITLSPDGTFTHALLGAKPARDQRGRWRVYHDLGKPTSTVAFDDYSPPCVVPEEQCDLARYMGQALASGYHEIASVCRVHGRMALCFNESDEYVRR